MTCQLFITQAFAVAAELAVGECPQFQHCSGLPRRLRATKIFRYLFSRDLGCELVGSEPNVNRVSVAGPCETSNLGHEPAAQPNTRERERGAIRSRASGFGSP